MVPGLEKFKEYLGDYSNQYVFIGGTACDILLDEIGVPFRATKDLDIVLVIEALNASFGREFWKLIENGGYEHREKGVGREQFYRFSKPNKVGYPFMIELFCRAPYDFDLEFKTGLTPIHIEDSIVSLSAILLDDIYYEALLNSRKIVDGYSVIELEMLILFKIRAWLDMKARQQNGEQVDSKNIKKHKNDVFRLLANVAPTSKSKVGEGIRNDVRLFIEEIDNDRPDLKNLGIKAVSYDQMIDLLKDIYLS